MAISFNNGANPETVKFNNQDVTAINFNGMQVWSKNASEWQTVWTGSQTFSSAGSFTVPELAAGGNIQITANATFDLYIVSGDYYEHLGSASGSISRQTLPGTIWGNEASIGLSRNGSQIFFTFNNYEEYAKGYSIWEIPTSITITEVRRQS